MSELTFPDNNYVPAKSTQFSILAFIARLVCKQFFPPEFSIVFGPHKVLTPMHMPETTVDKNNGIILFQYNIRRTRKFLYVASVPEAVGKKIFCYKLLRSGFFTFDTRHIIAARLLIMDIHYLLLLSFLSSFRTWKKNPSSNLTGILLPAILIILSRGNSLWCTRCSGLADINLS